MKLRIEDLTYKYKDGVEALHKANFALESQTFLMVLGESGCGKSTLLKVIAGIFPQTSGKVFIDDEDVSEYTTGSRDLTMVFQEFALYPHLTIYENVLMALNGFPLKDEEKDLRVKTILKEFGLQCYLNFKPRNLSEGQKQRVAICRALIREPSIMLLDEPLANLDVPQRRKILNELKSIYSKGKCTFVYVTHDLKDATSAGETIAIMHAGEVIQVGSYLSIKKKPVSLKACELINGGEVNELSLNDTLKVVTSSRKCHAISSKKNVLAIPFDSLNIQENGGIFAKFLKISLSDNTYIAAASLKSGETVSFYSDESILNLKENDPIELGIVSDVFIY